MNTSRKLLLSASLLLVAAVNAQMPVMPVMPVQSAGVLSLVGNSIANTDTVKHALLPVFYAIKNGGSSLGKNFGQYFYNKGITGSLTEAAVVSALIATTYGVYKGYQYLKDTINANNDPHYVAFKDIRNYCLAALEQDEKIVQENAKADNGIITEEQAKFKATVEQARLEEDALAKNETIVLANDAKVRNGVTLNDDEKSFNTKFEQERLERAQQLVNKFCSKIGCLTVEQAAFKAIVDEQVKLNKNMVAANAEEAKKLEEAKVVEAKKLEEAKVVEAKKLEEAKVVEAKKLEEAKVAEELAKQQKSVGKNVVNQHNKPAKRGSNKHVKQVVVKQPVKHAKGVNPVVKKQNNKQLKQHGRKVVAKQPVKRVV
jgi:hypothetical protein